MPEERLLARSSGAQRPRDGNVGGGSGLPLAWTLEARMLPKASRRKSAQRSQAAPAEGRRPLALPTRTMKSHRCVWVRNRNGRALYDRRDGQRSAGLRVAALH